MSGPHDTIRRGRLAARADQPRREQSAFASRLVKVAKRCATLRPAVRARGAVYSTLFFAAALSHSSSNVCSAAASAATKALKKEIALSDESKMRSRATIAGFGSGESSETRIH
jgi:hypothetical protein